MGLSRMIEGTLLINRNVILSVIFHFIGFALKGPCELYFNGCCPNTQWDSMRDMCVECPSGYFWANCSRPCEYPSYGPKCSKNCSCERINCNHTSGCKNDSSRVQNTSPLTTVFGIGGICPSPTGCFNRYPQPSFSSSNNSNIYLNHNSHLSI